MSAYNFGEAFGKRRIARDARRIEVLNAMKTHAIAVSALVQIPQDAAELVLFAHGSGRSWHSPHNQAVARLAAAWFQQHLGVQR